jgi:UDP-2-acetamido-3-amino-2,3-dideoxy-glucuronate N-acetyltransferase
MNHIRTLSEMGCLGGIAETKEQTRGALKKQFTSTPLFTDVGEALRGGFAGFIVATPAETHAGIAREIIHSGAHVLVEKPLAMTVAEARQLRKQAQDAGVNLMVGHVLLFHPAIRKIRELIREGRIGRLQYLYSNRLNLGTVRTEENILWSFAPHDISIFQELIGEQPVSVESHGGEFLQPRIHDSTMTFLRFPNNIVGHIFVSWLHPFKEHRLVIIGSKGMFVFEDSSESKDILYYEKGIDWVAGEPIKRDGPTDVIPYERCPPLRAELEYFVDHLDGRPIEIANGQNAVEVLETLERATASLLGSTDAGRGGGSAGGATADYFVHPTSFVDDGVEIGAGTKVWHFSHVQSGARIGAGCTLGQNVNVGSNVRIGDGCKIQNNVSIYEGVELEDYVFCGPSMVFTNILDPRCKYPQRGGEHYKPTRVREGASIGANATIVCGHSIGRHAFIAAGAVVTGDVADYALMKGVPGRRAGWVCECGEVLGEVKKHAACRRCGRKYAIRDKVLHSAE